MTITVRPVRSQTSTIPYCPQASVSATGHLHAARRSGQRISLRTFLMVGPFVYLVITDPLANRS